MLIVRPDKEVDEEKKSINSQLILHHSFNYQYLRQVDQHFKNEHNIRQISRNIRQADRLRIHSIRCIDSCVKRLFDLKGRISFHSNSKSDVHNDIKYEIKNSLPKHRLIVNKLDYSKHLLQENPEQSRGSDILSGIGQTSDLKTKTNGEITNKNAHVRLSAPTCHEIKNMIKTKPQAPLNLHLKWVGHNSVSLGWSPPILNGGDPISEYQVSFSPTKVEKKGKRMNRTIMKPIIINCSRWCLKRPVPNYGFFCSNLSASTEFVNLRVKCRNSIGWSSFSKPLKTFKTKDPISPSRPLFFRVSDITSSEIGFTWTHCLDTGGSQLVEYELQYIEVVPMEHQSLGIFKNTKKVNEASRCHKVCGSATSTLLNHLCGGTTFKSFELRGINAAGLKSEPVLCEEVTTKLPSYSYRLEKEIERVRNCLDLYIDTDFFQGITQREERTKYLIRLEHEMRHCLRKNGQKNIEMKHNDSKNINQNKEENQKALGCDFDGEFQQRTNQFQFRIDSIQDQLVKFKICIDNIDRNRVLVTSQMCQTQERIYSFTSELDRVTRLKEKETISYVFHGSNQHFQTDQLRTKLEDTIKEARKQISQWKIDIIEGEKQKKDLVKSIHNSEIRLRERREALILFQHQAARVDNMKEKMFRSRKTILLDYFQKLKTKKLYRVRLKHILQILAVKCEQKIYLFAFKKWKNDSSALTITRPKRSCISMGDVLLHETETMYSRNICLNSSLLIELNSADVETYSNTDLSEEEKIGMIRGDCHFNNKQYEESYECYFDSYMLSSNTEARSEKFMISSALIVGKIGLSLMNLCQWERSILYFEKQLRLGNILTRRLIRAQALSGLGTCYLGMGDYKEAEHLFERGLVFCTSNDRDAFYAKCRSGIQQCRDGFNGGSETSLDVKEFFSLNNDEVLNKTRVGIDTTMRLKTRLMKFDVNSEKIITLENVSPLYVEMRRQKKKLMENIASSKSQHISIKNVLLESKQLMQKITLEINQAIKSNDTTITSASIHENTQKFERNELIIRLRKKYKSIQNSLDEQTRKLFLVTLKINNLHDDLRHLEQEMSIENGPLMKRVLKNRAIRCIGLNSSNAHASKVTGDSICGIEYIAVTYNQSTHVHSLQNGELFIVFHGDKSPNHAGDPFGHTAPITCIFFENLHVYTGSMDNSIMCWDTRNNERLFVARGHKGSVTSIFVDSVKMVTGSADKLIGLWDKFTGDLIRLVPGHSSGISSIHSSLDWCVSSGYDGEIFLWFNNNDGGDLDYKHFKQQKRFKGNSSLISVVKYGGFELVTGDHEGFVKIWYIRTGDILKTCKAHVGKVSDLQFDATKIVSCGSDLIIQIIDLIEGSILKSLRGHETPILRVSFDKNRILSASCDGTLRVWNLVEANDKNDNFHIFSQNDSIPSICQCYDVKSSDFLRWNKIENVDSVRVGQKLIVRKVRPKNQHDESIISRDVKNKESSNDNDIAGRFERNRMNSLTKLTITRKNDINSLSNRIKANWKRNVHEMK